MITVSDMTVLAKALALTSLLGMAQVLAGEYEKVSSPFYMLSINQKLIGTVQSSEETLAQDMARVEETLLVPNIYSCAHDNVLFIEVPNLEPRELAEIEATLTLKSEQAIDTVFVPYVYRSRGYVSKSQAMVHEACGVADIDPSGDQQTVGASVNSVLLPAKRSTSVASYIERLARDALEDKLDKTLIIVRAALAGIKVDGSETDGSDTRYNIASTSKGNDAFEDWKMTSVFDRYSFFTPGLLSGLIVTWLLLFILTVSLTWTSGLKVSYKAFEPERKTS